MVSTLVDYDQLGLGTTGGSAREFVSQHITDPLLAEMIFCPILYYGGARERDMEFGQFCIMFRSIFLEGFARPIAGVRLILQKLYRKFKSLGGELRLRAGVEKIDAANGRVRKVVLSDGTELETENVLSSAGWFETMRLCSDMNQEPEENDVGQLAFIETISVLDKEPKQLGHKQTIVFFNDSDKFEYTKPTDLVDLRSGVICSPNNFNYEKPLDEGMIRITALANFDSWAALDETAYRLQKLRWYDKTLASAIRFVPDFRGSIVEADMFTPLTIHRYTGKKKGAIYGAPEKRYTGQTHLENLYICGTDQGMVGIIGAIVSGITITSKYLLK
jgi:phytoene dehydrogenase-like protein